MLVILGRHSRKGCPQRLRLGDFDFLVFSEHHRAAGITRPSHVCVRVRVCVWTGLRCVHLMRTRRRDREVAPPHALVDDHRDRAGRVRHMVVGVRASCGAVHLPCVGGALGRPRLVSPEGHL